MKKMSIMICKKFATYAKKDFSLIKRWKFKIDHEVRDHCHYTREVRGAAHSICNLRYKTSKDIPAIFCNGSTYDYHFIIKQLAK